MQKSRALGQGASLSSVCVGKWEFCFFGSNSVNGQLVQENHVVNSRISLNLLEIFFWQMNKIWNHKNSWQNIKEYKKNNKKNKKPTQKQYKVEVYIHNKHQHNTDDGGQAMKSWALRHVQMSRWNKHTGEGSEQQQGLLRQRAVHFNTTFHYKNK